MLTCIACSKQHLADGGGGGDSSNNPRRTKTPSSTKPAVKTLASQIKDAVLKLSGAYRQCKATGPSSISRVHQRTHHQQRSNGVVDCDGWRDGESHYPRLIGRGDGGFGGGGSSSSTPAWDFTRTSDNSRHSEAWDLPVMVEDSEEPKEWVAQVEPGVHITFLNLSHGTNDLKRIRFDRQLFNKWQAQRWWGENYDRIMELYNVQRFNRQAMPTTAPTRSEDDIGGEDVVYPTPDPTEYFFPQYQAPTNTTSDIVEATEWMEENEPGVFVTIRQLTNGTRDLRRVRFSRQRFGEVNAKLWWEQNRDRIHAQYL